MMLKVIDIDGSRRSVRSFMALAVVIAVISSLLLLGGVAVGAPGDLVIASSTNANAPSLPASYAYQSSISADGRYVAFASTSANLFPGVSAGDSHVYRKDLLTSQIILCSANSTGIPAIGTSSWASISADGRYVAFTSDATNFPLGPSGFAQVYRKDLLNGQNGHLDVCSTSTTGVLGNSNSDQPSISADGSYVSFYSSATNFAAASGLQVYRKDAAGGVISLCSSSAIGVAGSGTSSNPAISGDGRYVAFASQATNLISGVTGTQVYRKDTATEQVLLCSADATGAQGNLDSIWPSVSADGRYVAFQSGATNLAGLTGWQVYRKDLDAGVVIPCSTDESGLAFSTAALCPSIDADGRYVAFYSYLKDDPLTIFQVFRKDLLTGSALICSSTSSPSYASQIRGDGNSGFPPAISGDGKFVSFFSLANNLAPPGAALQIYRKEVGPEPLKSTWYLAEGSTAWGFAAQMSIENPNAEEVHAQVTYMTPGGEVGGPLVTLPGVSQATLNPFDTLGEQDFSTKVVCNEGKTIAVDRTMTWQGAHQDAPPEAHTSIGVTSPSTNWYLAEGSSDWGFETWLLIQNPNAQQANCTVTYMIEGEGPVEFLKTVPANSRQTFNMEVDIGKKDASIAVNSDVPVIPERAMYRNDRREGHDSIGTTNPADDFFLSEGSSAWGFTTFVLIQNPNSSACDVTVTYMTTNGTVATDPLHMEPGTRKTINVNSVLPGADFSTQVHGTLPIIAERAMYWDNGTGEACHDSIGMSLPHMTFYLPDGQDSSGWETWTLVQNPNATETAITISYLTPTGQGNYTFDDTLPANSRRSYSMGGSPYHGRAAILVLSRTAGNPIMCERAMYCNNRGMGTDTIGGYSD